MLNIIELVCMWGESEGKWQCYVRGNGNRIAGPSQARGPFIWYPSGKVKGCSRVTESNIECDLPDNLNQT